MFYSWSPRQQCLSLRPLWVACCRREDLCQGAIIMPSYVLYLFLLEWRELQELQFRQFVTSTRPSQTQHCNLNWNKSTHDCRAISIARRLKMCNKYSPTKESVDVRTDQLQRWDSMRAFRPVAQRFRACMHFGKNFGFKKYVHNFTAFLCYGPETVSVVKLSLCGGCSSLPFLRHQPRGWMSTQSGGHQ